MSLQSQMGLMGEFENSLLKFDKPVKIDNMLDENGSNSNSSIDEEQLQLREAFLAIKADRFVLILSFYLKYQLYIYFLFATHI